jgi:hypothetical protein
MQNMKRETQHSEKKNTFPVSPKVVVANQLLAMARTIRRSGNPQVAREAADWEEKIAESIASEAPLKKVA